jgi:LruC domain-containing protein
MTPRDPDGAARDFRRGCLALLSVIAVVSAPAPSRAQADSDADGAADSADVFPCDAERAAVSWYPSEGSSALLAYEDEWPSSTDLDFNDVVIRTQYRVERHHDGRVKQLFALFDPVALGGDHANGLGLQLPAPRLLGGASNVTVRRRLAGGAWESVAVESDPNVTVVVSSNLRELYGSPSGRINSPTGAPQLEGSRLELEVTFTTPVAFSASLPFVAGAEAPFDVFIFRAGTEAPNRHEIHFPQFAGTQSMNTALFNSGQDTSELGVRYFIQGSGIPAALNLQSSELYPTEGTRIDLVFPAIVTFAASRGASASDFYDATKPANNVSPHAQARHSVAARAVPGWSAPACENLTTLAQLVWSTSDSPTVAPTEATRSFGTRYATVETREKSYYLRHVGPSGAASAGVTLTGDTAHFRLVRVEKVSNSGISEPCNAGGTISPDGLSTTAPCFTDPLGQGRANILVVVRYAPVDAGEHTASLALSSGNGTGLPAALTVSGTGLATIPSVAWSTERATTVAPTAEGQDFGMLFTTVELREKVFYLRNAGTPGSTASVGFTLVGDTSHFRLVSVEEAGDGGSLSTCSTGGLLAADGLSTIAPCVADPLGSGRPNLRVRVRYAPLVAGNHQISVVLSTGNGTVLPAPLVLAGVAQDSLPVAWSTSPSALVLPTPTTTDFGRLTASLGYEEKLLYMRNVLHGSAIAVGFSLSGDTQHFRLVRVRRATDSASVSSCNSSTGAVAPGGLATSSACLADAPASAYRNIRVEVAYSPLTVGEHSVTLSLTTSNGTPLPGSLTLTGRSEFNPEVQWSSSGSSVVPLTPAILDFGTQTVDTVYTGTDRTVYLRNVGTNGQASVAFALGGSNPTHFRIVSVRREPSSACNSGGVVAPDGQSATACLADDVGGVRPGIRVVIRFSPTAIGSSSATLIPTSDNGTAVPEPITFTGAGERNPALTWAMHSGGSAPPGASDLHFGTQNVGRLLERNFNLRNVGTHGAASVGLVLSGDTQHFAITGVQKTNGGTSTAACNSGGGIAANGLSTTAPCVVDDIWHQTQPHVFVRIRYAPVSPGSHTLTVGLVTDNGTVLPAALTLTGVAQQAASVAWSTAAGTTTPLSAPDLDFGARALNTEVIRTYYLRASGAFGSAGVGFTLTGDTSHFRLTEVRTVANSGSLGTCNYSTGGLAVDGFSTTTPCVANDLALSTSGNNHILVRVRHRPTSAGSHSVVLTPTSTNGTVVPGAITLTGSGT